MEQPQICQHLKALHTLKEAAKYECEECMKVQGSWLHLRTCQTCGVTLCCDDSPSQHMTQHYHTTGHPVVTSSEPGERWLWCYKDEVFAEY